MIAQSTKSLPSKHKNWSQIHRTHMRKRQAWLGRQRQTDSARWVANLMISRLEISCLNKQTNRAKAMTPKVVLWPSYTYTSTCLYTHIYNYTYTHTQRKTIYTRLQQTVHWNEWQQTNYCKGQLQFQKQVWTENIKISGLFMFANKKNLLERNL